METLNSLYTHLTLTGEDMHEAEKKLNEVEEKLSEASFITRWWWRMRVRFATKEFHLLVEKYRVIERQIEWELEH